MLAIANCGSLRPRKPRFSPRAPRKALLRLLFLTTLAGFGFHFSACGGDGDAQTASFAARAREIFVGAQKRLLAEPTNAVAAWEFARACFDRAEYATNDAERAIVAEQGIVACRRLLARQTGSAPAHYYLGMNLGQLARTKTFGALRIVDEMEREFKTAVQLDEDFDYAGPDRNLGLLYFEAPAFASVGSRSKARQHLQRAAQLAPDFPENRLNLAEVYLKWADTNGAARELKALDKLWPKARTNFIGEAWAASWSDWETRLKRARKTIAERAK
jgi:tetratricopeptide (TPR) repeat protein